MNKNIVFITLFVFVAAGSLSADGPHPQQQYSLSEGRYLSIPARHSTLPKYVYGDESGKLTDYVASGFMGDSEAVSALASAYDETAPASTGRTGKTSLRIRYVAKGRQAWAGIYWLSPANNWGNIKGAGFDLSSAVKLTFWARGLNGGEKIASFKVGGVNGPYPDSDEANIGPIVLSKEWQQYTINLAGKDLRHIVGGFAFIIRRADNNNGATFYLDEVVFVGKEGLVKSVPMKQSEPPVDFAAESTVPVVPVAPVPVVAPEPKIPVPVKVQSTATSKPSTITKPIKKKNKITTAAVAVTPPPSISKKRKFGWRWVDFMALAHNHPDVQNFLNFLNGMSRTDSPLAWAGDVCPPLLPLSVGNKVPR